MNCQLPSVFDNNKEQLIKQNQQQLSLSEEQNINNKQEDPSSQLQNVHKVFHKNQAFSNFIKHHVTLFSQVEKGVTIKMINHNTQEQDKDYKIKNVKSVQFNLQNNYIYFIVKHSNEYLTLNEKFNLQKSIHYYAMKNRFDSTSEDDDDEVEDQHSVIEIVVKEVIQQPKSILKKQFQEFKHEAVDDDGEYFQNKGLTSKEIRNLEKKVKEHDYGVGLKLLQKLGFKYGEGLGINRQGILEPVIPMNKQVFAGTLSNHNKVNKEDQVWQYNHNKENKNTRKLDKIGRKRNQIDMYQISEQSNQIDSKENINLDYLGKISELTQSVQHQLLNKLSIEQIIQQERNRKITLENEKEKTINNLEKQKECIKKNQSFKKYLLFFQDDEVQIQDKPFPLFQKFSECFIQHPDLFIQFNLIDVLIKQVCEEIIQISKSWEGPTKDILENEFKLIYKIVKLGQDVIIYLKSQTISSNNKDSLITENLIANTDLINLQRMIDILINPISQKLQIYICKKYDPNKENLLFEMLNLWTTDITSIETDEIEDNIQLFNSNTIKILNSLIIPKLQSTISNWSSNDSIQLHKIILPWIDSQFTNQELSNQMINKLMNMDLEDQHDFGLSVLSPWSRLFDTQWNQILQKQVITKMLHCIQNLDVISNFDVIQCILQYFDFITDKVEILFEPLINKLNEYVCTRILEHSNCRDSDIYHQISQWLNKWELILQENVLSNCKLLSEKFNLIKEMLIQ